MLCRATISLLLLSASVAPAADAPSFRNDVMAVLSRAGCNQGACHGNLNGKGGFKLSLRGEDADFDRNVLTRDAVGRRTSPNQPEESLILRKAAGVVSHEGGPRFGRDSLEYRIIRDWIAAGCPLDRADLPRITKLEVSPRKQVLVDPENKLKLSVKGRFSDGSTRDLSQLVVFETTAVGIVNISPDGEITRQQPGELVVIVRYLDKQVPVQIAFVSARPEFVWKDVPLTNPIDKLLYPQWKELRLTPSSLSNDSMFFRRAYLDVVGLLPTADETRTFLKDTRTDKRARLIDALLHRAEFAEYWAQKWADLLRNEEKSLDRKGVRVFYQWLRDAIAKGQPLNEFAREIISARGSTYQNPPSNFYRSLREPYGRAEAVAQVFLGTRIQCAKCHNHPFDVWTQNDYHDFAAIFSTIDYRILENDRKDRLDKHEFVGEQIVFQTRESSLKHPRSGEPLKPRLLGERAYIADESDRLQALADWVADPKNPYFAKAQVNRVWYHLFGRGLIDPIDDFRSTNPAVNQELLDYLAAQFSQAQPPHPSPLPRSGGEGINPVLPSPPLRGRGQGEGVLRGSFDLRSLIKDIMLSRTYQLSSDDAETNHDDETHFSKSIIQPLEAEQLLDAVCQVLDVPVKFYGYPIGTRSMQIASLQQADRRNRNPDAMAEKFLKVFGKPDRLLTCECERSDDTGVLQSFQLLTGELLHSLLNDENNRIGKLIAAGKNDGEIIETFFLAALSRYPTAKEKEKLTAFVAKAKDRRAALEDVVWGLVNAKEFLLRR